MSALWGSWVFKCMIKKLTKMLSFEITFPNQFANILVNISLNNKRWISLKSMGKGLFKNVQYGIFKPLGSWEVHKTKNGYGYRITIKFESSWTILNKFYPFEIFLTIINGFEPFWSISNDFQWLWNNINPLYLRNPGRYIWNSLWKLSSLEGGINNFRKLKSF